mgnify:CR=1 FL=1
MYRLPVYQTLSSSCPKNSHTDLILENIPGLVLLILWKFEVKHRTNMISTGKPAVLEENIY